MSNIVQTLLDIAEESYLLSAEKQSLRHIAQYVKNLELELNRIDPELMETLNKTRKEPKS